MEGNNLEHLKNRSSMDEEDIVDNVNALLNLGVGDAYRLEHIKQSYIENKTIWVTDQSYLQHMTEKYLIKRSNIQTNSEDNSVKETEEEDKIHCWKCGKKSSLGANFCMVCGASLFEVATDSEVERESIPSNLTNKTKSINLKIPIMIGIPVLILAIIGGAYSQGYFDNTFERYDSEETEKIDTKSNVVDSTEKVVSAMESNSKCGAGTVFDSETNSCVLDK
ncbi:MAG: zinc-ribbon domain-containing protein [Nitrosopumilus sp.]